jgi:hypothetical protein
MQSHRNPGRIQALGRSTRQGGFCELENLVLLIHSVPTIGNDASALQKSGMCPVIA